MPELTNTKTVGQLRARLGGLESAVLTGGVTYYDTWADLSAVSGTVNGEKAIVVGPDGGQHYDPAALGNVDNIGQYEWVATGPNWERVADTLASDIAILTQQTEAAAAQAAADASLARDILSSLGEPAEAIFGRDPLFSEGTTFSDRFFFVTPIPYNGTISSVNVAERAVSGVLEVAVYRDASGTLTRVQQTTATLSASGSIVERALAEPLNVLVGDIIGVRSPTDGTYGFKDMQSNYWGDGFYITSGAFTDTIVLGAGTQYEPQVNFNVVYDVQVVTTAAFNDHEARITANEAATAASSARNDVGLPFALAALQRGFYEGRAASVIGVNPLTSVNTTLISSSIETEWTLTGAGVNEYVKETPLVRRLNGPWTAGATFPSDKLMFQRNTDYGEAGKKVGTNPVVEFLADADAIETYSLFGAEDDLWVMVDGQLTQLNPYTVPTRDGSVRYLRLDFSSKAVRRIRLIPGSEVSFGSWRVRGDLLDPTPKIPSTAYFMGDSITEGLQAPMFYRWPVQVGRLLGIDSVANGGIGQTGYLQTGSYPPNTAPNFRDRADDVLTMVDGGPPGLFVIAGGINDSAFSDAQIEAAAKQLFEELQAGAPEMIICAVGVLTGKQGFADANIVSRSAAIEAALAEIKNGVYVDPTPIYSDPDWQTYFDPGDSTHPLQAGHTRMAEYLSVGISRAVRPLL